MAFTPKTAACGGRIQTVTLGTGDTAVTLGGQNTLPFYTFDAPTVHPPRIGMEISDLAEHWTQPGLAEFYQGCQTMAQRAEKAQSLAGVDFLVLNFESADPNGADRPVARCVEDALAVAQVANKPLAVMGCRNLQKDGQLFTALSEALLGKNILVLSAKAEDYKTLGAAVALAGGHKLCAETADDVNLAKQLNIMLSDLGVRRDSLVMNIGTAAVGYGFEYVASTLDRVRLAALEQGDEDLSLPIIAPVSTDTWGMKESTATEEDEPAWGDAEERGIHMEVATAAACLTGGADAVILRHPESVSTIHEFLTALI